MLNVVQSNSQGFIYILLAKSDNGHMVQGIRTRTPRIKKTSYLRTKNYKLKIQLNALLFLKKENFFNKSL